MSKQRIPKKIVISNIVSLNTGDAAILMGMFSVLRKKYGADTQFIVFDKSSSVASRYYPWANFRRAIFGHPPRSRIGRMIKASGYGHWNDRIRYFILSVAAKLLRFKLNTLARILLKKQDYESVSDYVNADLIVSAGGTYLVENYSLWTNIWDYRLSLASGTPLFFFTQTLGPFTLKKYRRAFAHIFSNSSGIALRDEKSMSHIIELGVDPSNVCIARDAAFVIEPKVTERPAGPLRVAVSVRTLRFFEANAAVQSENYQASIVAMVVEAVRKFGAEVSFLSTCQGIDEYWTDDSVFAANIAAKLPDDVLPMVTVDKKFRQPDEVAVAYQGFDLVIATRMHAAILSLVAGTPVIGIAYEFKLNELFRQLGLEQASVSTNDMNPGNCKALLRTILGNLDSWRVKARDTRVDCRKKAFDVVEKLPNL